MILLLIASSLTHVYGPFLQIFMQWGSVHSGAEQCLVHTPPKADARGKMGSKKRQRTAAGGGGNELWSRMKASSTLGAQQWSCRV